MHRVISRYRRNVRRAVLLALTALLMLVNVPAGATPEPFLQEVSFPTNMAFLPDGTLLFTEKETGDVRAVTPGGELLDRPSATLQVVPGAERGLLGIAVHPDFEREPWIYLYFSDPADGLNRLVRVRTDGSRASGEPEKLLVGLSASAGYHNGGDMVFAADGTLFLAIGEAHESDRAQDPNDIGGKVVRLTADGGVPADNPFGAANPVWSIGHRNSFGLCIDPATGELWETENGPSVDDEVNLIEEGANFGWPVVTGRAGDDRFVDPVAVFVSPIALTGCAVVDGSVWFGSFDGRLWRLDSDDDAAAPEQIARFPSGVTDVALGPDRVLYVATTDAIWTVELAFDAGPERSAWKTWVATGAIAVLVASLGARFLAGRRLRGDRPSVGA
jgi:glucose/arabinose dehydrogenase